MVNIDLKKCKECSKEINFLDWNNNPTQTFIGVNKYHREYYEINIGDETERKWKKNKFTLCIDCWNKKKEGYKSSVGNLENGYWKDRKIEVKIIAEQLLGGTIDATLSKIGNCLVCKKWDEGGKIYDRGGYCSLDCEKNKDIRSDNRERERDENWPSMPQMLGIGAIILLIVGIIAYFWWKKNKTKSSNRS